MSIHDLDKILNKEAIIATYPSEYLRSNPEQVELMYRTHALTHIPLGDTSRYVDTIFKWVSGQNKGAFVGAVVGDYGHGKTSFQVHIWEESTQRKVLAVPPFSWKRVADMLDGTAAWISHVLGATHPDQARQSKMLYEKYREKSLRETAEEISKTTKQSVESIIQSLETAIVQGTTIKVEITPDRFLEYFEELTAVVKAAGFNGLLLLLDEPEVAAKELGAANVSQILFDLANGLLQRQGDCGVFISIPENFLASVQKSFSSLPARLQARNCMPRLRDIYGSDFAQQLWSCYMRTFDLGDEGGNIVIPETLVAIGQVASSERRDLSYGPRTVVSAFRQMVHNYKETGQAYKPENFVDDCLDDEVLVSPNYPSRIKECLNRPEASDLDERSLKVLAAFPIGVKQDVLESLGVVHSFLERARANGLLYKAHNLYGLKNLRRDGDGQVEKEPEQSIEEIFSEFAPSPKTFVKARDAFISHVIPLLFRSRSGQQLIGWDHPKDWKLLKHTVKSAEFVGSFDQTVSEYPRRRIAVAVGPAGIEVKTEELFDRGSEPTFDILIHIRLRWHQDGPLPSERVMVDQGNPLERRSGVIRLTLDLIGDGVEDAQLEQLVDRSLLTPMGILYLFGEMDRKTLPHEASGVWKAVMKGLLNRLPTYFFDSTIREQAAREVKHQITGGVTNLVGSLCQHVLRKRYPEYSTLIRQPHWESKVKEYIKILQNQNIPLACKRGREPWKAPKSEVANAFGTTVMNLGDYFGGFENLLSIKMGKSKEDDASVEFKVHPLEESIMAQIMSDRRVGKLKIEGKECWWIDQEEVIPIIFYSGYHLEEIQNILSIGKCRHTFYAADHKGRLVLYIKPMDPDQMKTQLRDKLEALKEQIEELSKIPEYRYSNDTARVAERIEAIKDEADYESVLSTIHRAFEQNNDRMQGYFGRLEELLETEIGNAQQLEERLKNSRQVVSLQTPPTGFSKWCSDLNMYIVANMNSIAEEIKKKCRSIKQEAGQSKNGLTFPGQGTITERIKRLQDGWATLDDLKVQVKSISSEAQRLSSYLDEYEQWRKLLGSSDDVCKQLLEMKKDQTHETKAAELLEELDSVWGDISHHLSTRNVDGLGSHKQYFEKIHSVDQARKTYQAELRVAFDKQKDTVNSLLQELQPGGDKRVAEVFNPADSPGSYERLYDQAVSVIRSLCEAELADLERQRLELLYARDVLKRFGEDEAGVLLEKLVENSSLLMTTAGSITIKWLKEVLSGGGNLKMGLSEVKNVLSGTREASRESRTALRQSQPKEPDKMTKEEESMLRLVPEGQAVDLKQIVLGLINRAETSTDVLDITLKSLSELFRKQKIQIKVVLPRK